MYSRTLVYPQQDNGYSQTHTTEKIEKNDAKIIHNLASYWHSFTITGINGVFTTPTWVVQVQLEGAQRVYISAKYTIMLWCTRLHVYICASLVMYVRSRRLPTIMTSSIMTACSGVCGKSIGNGVNFCTFLLNPHFDFEPDYVVRKPRKRRFQRYIVRTEIFSTFHARVEYISVKTVVSGK